MLLIKKKPEWSNFDPENDFALDETGAKTVHLLDEPLLPARGSGKLREIISDLPGKLVSRKDLRGEEEMNDDDIPPENKETASMALDAMLTGLDAEEGGSTSEVGSTEEDGPFKELMGQKQERLGEVLETLDKEPQSSLLLVNSQQNVEAKSKATKFQQLVYDRALDFRIRLQKPLSIAQLMPLPNSALLRSKEVQKDNSLKRNLDEVYNLCLDVLDSIQDAEDKLRELNSDLEPIPAKRQKSLPGQSLEKTWEDIDVGWSGFLQTCYEDLEMWNRKTILLNAANLKQHKKMSEMEGFTTRMERIMAEDYNRLLDRSRTLPSDQRVLGTTETGEEKQSCSQVYRDKSLYQNLLRQVLANNTVADSEKQRALTEALEKKASRKARKRIKTKQRTLKYTLIPKLCNFAASNGKGYSAEATGFPVDSFFKSLFKSF